MAERKKLFRCHPVSHPSYVRLSPSGEYVAVKSTSGQILIISARTGGIIRTLENAGAGEGSNIEWSTDGGCLVDGSWNGLLCVREAATGSIIFERRFSHEKIRQVTRNATRSKWAIAHGPKWLEAERRSDPEYVSVWTWPLGKTHNQKLYIGAGRIAAIALSPYGSHLAVVTFDGQAKLSIMDLDSERSIAEQIVDYGGSGASVAWSSDGAFIASAQRRVVVVYEASSLKAVKSFESCYPAEISFSPDGQYLALGSWDAGSLLRVQDVCPSRIEL